MRLEARALLLSYKRLEPQYYFWRGLRLEPYCC